MAYNARSRLSLRAPLVEEFWEKQDAKTKSVLEWMKSAEHWTMDERHSLEGPLRRVTEALEKASPGRLQDSLGLLIQVMAYLSTPTAVRLIEWIEDRHGQAHAATGPARLGGPPPGVDLVEEMLRLAELQQSKAQRSHLGLKGVEGATESAVLLDRLQTLKSILLLKNIFRADRLRHITRILDEIQRASR